MSEIIETKEPVYIRVKNFHEVCYKLKEKYTPIHLFNNKGYRINGFIILPSKRKESLLVGGNLHGLEEFLEKEGIERISN
jgi:hypothetical protein